MTPGEIGEPERPARSLPPTALGRGPARANDLDTARSALNAAALDLARKAERLRWLATHARADDAPIQTLLDEIRSFESAADRARAAQDVLRARNVVRCALMRSPVGRILSTRARCVSDTPTSPGEDDRRITPIAYIYTQALTAAQREL